ncbi:hypothetical protein D210916BOD24_27510 [Alteromonas sp. D210916BOD_24]|uniref:YkgJ family cysteine cluster protein n=1 Tax=Alteromonas sp. D210916BOD_24 TaxID=3157618 RepID=UPI00399CFE6A
MNRLRELSHQVMDVYQTLSLEFSTFQKSQSLNCISQCGACCNKADIEVSPLEMLPFALHLFETGLGEQMLEELEMYNGFACKQYQRLSLDGNEGYCGIYDYRPGICRMFGAAGYTTKTGEATLSVCKPIKQALPEKYAQSLISIQKQNTQAIRPPMIAQGRQKLAQLDYELGKRLMPINDALRFVLEKVLTLSYYSSSVDDGVAA